LPYGADDLISLAQSDDTIAADVAVSTRSVLPITKIWEQPTELPLSASSRASSTALPRQISDTYIEQSVKTAVEPNVDALMPLYLTEELSPRFSRAKATKGYNLRRQAEVQEKTAHATGQVRQWRESGGDTGLEGALAAVGLDGVSLRARTSKEVREAAEQEYAAAQHERSRIARMAKRVGGRFDVDNDTWRVQISPADARRKAKKARRAVNREERLRATAL
jgi:large subunit ribosomal protein L24